MNTISVKIEQPNHAAMLVEWLKNIRFVKEVDVKVDAPAKKGNAGEIMKMIDSMKGNPYADIKDPVAYQRQLRDEWERQKVLIDTNVIIYSTQDKLKLHDFLNVEDSLYISSITYIEALGIPFQDKREESKIIEICKKFERLFLTEEVEKQTILIRKSRKIKLPDAIIAATAIVHNLTLVTRNSDDFKNVPKLKMLNPFDN